MKNVLIIFGGKSAEHEVSIQSARNIIAALDKQQFKPICVGISRLGCWYYFDNLRSLEQPEKDFTSKSLCHLMRTPKGTVISSLDFEDIPIDIVFPVIHGPKGEDGTLQGLLEMMELPYVGSGVLSSAVGMDKEILKILLKNANIPVVPFLTLHKHQTCPSYQEICHALNTSTIFVKPARLGSSVGIFKVTNEQQYEDALSQAFDFDVKVLIEKFIPCREIECAVLGNVSPIASCVGEIKPTHAFYSYEAKYLDPDGAKLIIPAGLQSAIAERVRQLAIQSFSVAECKGLARVDFFLSPENDIYVNELNTMPGFTSISMYPKLWEASGISYQDLISKLINFAVEEFLVKQQLHLTPNIAQQSALVASK